MTGMKLKGSQRQLYCSLILQRLFEVQMRIKIHEFTTPTCSWRVIYSLSTHFVDAFLWKSVLGTFEWHASSNFGLKLRRKSRCSPRQGRVNHALPRDVYNEPEFVYDMYENSVDKG